MSETAKKNCYFLFELKKKKEKENRITKPKVKIRCEKLVLSLPC